MARQAVFVCAFLVLVFAPSALAAPPPNDNRADAQPIETFPAALHGTTVEATVERLDPQVSECGPIAATVWYRIDTAPDGTIGIAVKADAAGMAPVVRVYSRASSTLREVTCDAGAAGGTASVSFDTVRGANYLVLVGRKPASTDGEFDLGASLTLPPEPPHNDKLAAAQRLTHLPAKVTGTTVGARLDDNDPEGCDLDGGTVWYRLRAAHDGLILVKLHANGKLDAILRVVARARSRLQPGACRQTNDKGDASLAFRGRRGVTYFLLVGEQQGSKSGTFSLSVFAAAAPEQAPGRALPAHAVRGTLDGLINVNDVWHTTMNAGTTYRIAFATQQGCAVLTLRRPGSNGTLVELVCNGYRTFTPGPDGGGRYIVEVLASPTDLRQPYRLQIAAAQTDDVGIGLPLANRVARRGALAPSGVDILDIYHFDVARRSDVKLTLASPGFGLRLLTDSGSRVANGTDTIRRNLAPGRYVVAVSAQPGTRGGAYRLSLLIRDITSTTLALPSPTVAPHTPVTISPTVTPSVSGVIEIQIDRFDPLDGWQFSKLVRVPVGSSFTWTPPAEGKWRIRATYRGSETASPSRSGYVFVTVQ